MNDIARDKARVEINIAVLINFGFLLLFDSIDKLSVFVVSVDGVVLTAILS